MNYKCFIVAEIGMNHMGDEAYADEYLKALGVAHPDGITFQVQTPAYYQEKSHQGLVLANEYYRQAARQVRGLGIQFGVSLCDTEKVPFFEEIGTSFYKVLSKDIGNRTLVSALLATRKPVYVSTGLSDEDEIGSFFARLDSEPSNLTLIHTQLSYDDADTNLRAIAKLREEFETPVAFGLHSRDANALYASLGFAPSALFFYVKGARQITHRDEEHAVPLALCHEMVAEIHRLKTMLGDGTKKKMGNRITGQKK